MDINVELLSRWYQCRAMQIERLSCRVDSAVDMVRLGIFHNVQVSVVDLSLRITKMFP